MEVISIKKENMLDYGKKSSTDVYSALIKITDVGRRAKEMIATISNTSWLENLGAVEKITFEARAQRTIEKIVEQILEKFEDEVTADFGEFMISESAQTFLHQSLGHIKVPLAELLKEKISGNPGFDFHTESNTSCIAFGEAKYSGSINPHPNAINQIVDFIKLKKDSAELIIIQNFVTEDAIAKSIEGKKAYVAAFSINSKNPNSIIKNALRSDAITPLLCFPELYIIGVEVDD